MIWWTRIIGSDWWGDDIDLGLHPPHVCPKPFPREIAEILLNFYVSSGIPCSQETKARIRLTLRDP